MGSNSEILKSKQDEVALREKLASAKSEYEEYSQARDNGGGQDWWSTQNAMTMSSVFLLFGLIVLFLSAYLLKIGKRSEDVLRIFGTVVIIIVATFLIVAGYSDIQIAPVMGLLGTIAGYLLGKNTSVSAQEKIEKDQ